MEEAGDILLRAHALTGDARWLTEAMSDAQYALGANPLNLSFITGLGGREPLRILNVDAEAMGVGPPPGITIYGDYNPFDHGWNWFHTVMQNDIWPNPFQAPVSESFQAFEYFPASAEYTVMQTMESLMFVTGYLAAQGMDDAVRGGPDSDVLYGTTGSDIVLGHEGADSIFGGDGDDRLSGGTGNDRLSGGNDEDSLNGGDGGDTLNGGTGDDFIFGGATAADLRDVAFGGDGRDSIDGGAGNDELNGGNGNDTILGGAGADTLVGNADNDLIAGGAGGDLMSGNAGADTLNGGFGFDRMNGGTGADQFFHQGVRDHGSDWIQDYAAAEGDVLAVGIAGATASQFQVNFATTLGAGSASVQEAFVIYRPTGQVLWALVDGADDTVINLSIGGQVFDLVF